MNSTAAGHADWHQRGVEPPATDAAAASDDAGPGFGFRLEDFKAIYRDAPYYSSGRDWSDYVPAYQYGRDAYVRNPGARFTDIEALLEKAWEAYKPPSRLRWVEARGAVEHAFQHARQMTHAPGCAPAAD